jgi:hypothetical protein
MAEARARPPPDECANCGATIPRGVHACPECGADERTGWREQSIYDGLDLPEEAFEDESAAHARKLKRGIAWYWWCVAVLLVLMLVFGAVAFR